MNRLSIAALVRGSWLLFFGDPAVRYSLLSRLVSTGLGPVVVMAVGIFLNPAEQGVYYVFGSLLQLRIFVDLGFSQSANQLLAHAFGNLKLDSAAGVIGEQAQVEKFLNTGSFISKIFLKLGIATIPVVGLTGYLYLAHSLRDHQDIDWIGPWWVMVLSVGAGVSSLGLLCIGDGTGQIAMTNRWRFIADSASIPIFVGVMTVGGGLWASAAFSWARTLFLFAPLPMALGKPLLSKIWHANSKAINYRKEVASLQLRNMVVWGMGYLCFYCYNPLTLMISGPIAAGIVGMNFQISNMVQGISMIWMSSKTPLMGNLAGAGDQDGLDSLHRKSLIITALSFAACAVMAIMTAWAAKVFIPAFGQRFGTLSQIGVLLCGCGAYIWTSLRASYIRARLVEPFAILSIVQGILTVGFLFLFLRPFHVMGASLAYLLVMISGAIWAEIVFKRHRAVLRQQPIPA